MAEEAEETWLKIPIRYGMSLPTSDDISEDFFLTPLSNPKSTNHSTHQVSLLRALSNGESATEYAGRGHRLRHPRD